MPQSYTTLLERDSAGLSLESLGFYSPDVSYYDIFTRLCFESDGVIIITTIAVAAFILYRLSGEYFGMRASSA